MKCILEMNLNTKDDELKDDLMLSSFSIRLQYRNIISAIELKLYHIKRNTLF